MVKHIISFFDKLEDKVRISLSHHPIPYSILGALGVVLLWRGIWETADLFPWFGGPLSIVVGLVILLFTGLLVSFFVGDSIILSGFKQEKKLAEKTENEVRAEQGTMQYVAKELQTISTELKHLEKKLDERDS